MCVCVTLPQLLEELACACLLDLTLKRLFFRSSRLLPRLLQWIDSFRAQATALATQKAGTVKGPLENSVTLNTGTALCPHACTHPESRRIGIGERFVDLAIGTLNSWCLVWLSSAGWQGNGAFSGTLGSLSQLPSSHASMVLLLDRVLACLRLLFACLYASEGVPERFGPLLGSVASQCHVSELVRLLSDDLTDVIRLFDQRPEK